MEAPPAEAISLAGILAANRVLLQPVTGRGEPFHRTWSPSQMNPAPLTKSVNAEPPVVADAGFSERMAGSTVKVAVLEVCPNEFTTVTLFVPAKVKSLAGMAAVSCVGVAGTNVVVRGELFQYTRLEVKPEPPKVRVKPELPAFREFGRRLVMLGGRLCPRINRLVATESAKTATKQAYWKKELPGGGVLPFMAVDSSSLRHAHSPGVPVERDLAGRC
jgi:hypothetical protein